MPPHGACLPGGTPQNLGGSEGTWGSGAGASAHPAAQRDQGPGLPGEQPPAPASEAARAAPSPQHSAQPQAPKARPRAAPRLLSPPLEGPSSPPSCLPPPLDMNYQQNLANSAAIRAEIQRFESVHPNIYSIYELLERVEEPLLQNQIREHVIAIEGRSSPGCRAGFWGILGCRAPQNPALDEANSCLVVSVLVCFGGNEC